MELFTVYHCGPQEIDVFNFENGVHFGGYNSALQAALRKHSNEIYVHECLLAVDKVYVSNDVGGDDAWKEVIKHARRDGCSVIQYYNKYEPDVRPSYIVLDSERIKLKKVECMAASDASYIVEKEAYYDYY